MDITSDLLHVPVRRFRDTKGNVWTGAACPVCERFVLRNGSNEKCRHYLNTTPTEIVFYREAS